MVSAVLRLVPERVRGLRLAEYEALVDAGLLDDAPVELLEGELVEVSPRNPAHDDVVDRVADALRRGLPEGQRVRVRSSFVVPPASVPEPDVAVVPDRRYDREHPREALLVVEVAVTSATADLQVKPAVYAAAAVPEYWVVDVPGRRLHRHRSPGPDGYADVEVLGDDRPWTAAALPAAVVDPADVLPRA